MCRRSYRNLAVTQKLTLSVKKKKKKDPHILYFISIMSSSQQDSPSFVDALKVLFTT